MTTSAGDLGHLARAKEGNFDLGWLGDTHSEWGVRAQPSRIGLTLRDIAIGSHGQHTLNALSIADTPLQVVADDPMGRDKFFRYAQTPQTLFDASGRRVPARS